jgi:hypothetical protein
MGGYSVTDGPGMQAPDQDPDEANPFAREGVWGARQAPTMRVGPLPKAPPRAPRPAPPPPAGRGILSGSALPLARPAPRSAADSRPATPPQPVPPPPSLEPPPLPREEARAPIVPPPTVEAPIAAPVATTRRPRKSHRTAWTVGGALAAIIGVAAALLLTRGGADPEPVAPTPAPAAPPSTSAPLDAGQAGIVPAEPFQAPAVFPPAAAGSTASSRPAARAPSRTARTRTPPAPAATVTEPPPLIVAPPPPQQPAGPPPPAAVRPPSDPDAPMPTRTPADS